MSFTVTATNGVMSMTCKGVRNVDALIGKICLEHGPCAFSVRPE